MSRHEERAPEGDVDLSTLPPPPAWNGGGSAEFYDADAEGDLVDLDGVALESYDATVEFESATRAGGTLGTRGAGTPATLLGWLIWHTGPRDSPRPGGTLLPGRHIVNGTRHIARSAHAWAYDGTRHPDAWRLDQLKPHYATQGARYDQWEAKIRGDMADRPSRLLTGSAAGFVALALLLVVLFWLGLFIPLALVLVAIYATLHGTGRHVAKTRAGTRAESVPDDGATRADATLGTPDPPRVPGRAEIEEALRFAGAIGKDEAISCEPVRSMRANGWATTVTLPRTTSAAKVIGRLTEIASAFDTVDQLVTMVPGKDSNRRVWLWVADRDPLTGMAPRSPLVEAQGAVNVWNGIPFGFTVAGTRVRVSAVGTHWLTVGASGSGKSRAFGLIPLGYALDPFTQMILLDPEGFGAWAPYRAVAEVIQGSTPSDLRRMAERLKLVVDVEMPRRQAVIDRILATEPKLLPNNEVDVKISRTKRYRLPAVFVGIEEAVTLFNCSEPFDLGAPDGKTIGQVAEEATGEIQRRGRKYAIGTGLVSQKATTKELASSITFGATTRFMLGCTSETQADSAIPGWRGKGMAPLKLKQAKPGRPGSGNPGAGYLEGVGLLEPEEDWVLLRSDYADGNEIADRMAHARERRLQIWPELLPDHHERPDDGPAGLAPAGPEGDPPPAGAPERLEELVAVFDSAEDQLLSATIIERLVKAYPDDTVYAGLTPRSMNAFFKPFGLRTSSVREGERKGKGLTRQALIEARNACPDEAEGSAPQPTGPSSGAGAGHAETASDQGCPDAPQAGDVPLDLSKTPDSAEGHAPGRERGKRRHLGQIPLPEVS